METDGLFLLVNLGQKDTGPQGGEPEAQGSLSTPRSASAASRSLRAPASNSKALVVSRAQEGYALPQTLVGGGWLSADPGTLRWPALVSCLGSQQGRV